VSEPRPRPGGDAPLSAEAPPDSDAMRVALAMVRADWQGDDDTVRELWAVADDHVEVARALTHLCRQNLETLASVAGVSTGETLHRMAGRLIPHPDAGHVTVIDLNQVVTRQDARQD
jgi:hypothetical protein